MDVKYKISDLILENNHQYVVAYKPSEMPVQADLSKDNSLLQILEAYTKTKLHLHTRLDRPVSGLVLLSKKDSARKHFLKLQENRKISKKYYAIVEGKFEGETNLQHYHKKDSKRKKAIISDNEETGFKKASLELKLEKHLDRYSILEIQLNTGRFHQIRAQLAKAGYPIKGDVKYGARRKNADRSIHLHAYSLGFLSPSSKEEMSFSRMPMNRDTLWQQLPTIY